MRLFGTCTANYTDSNARGEPFADETLAEIQDAAEHLFEVCGGNDIRMKEIWMPFNFKERVGPS